MRKNQQKKKNKKNLHHLVEPRKSFLLDHDPVAVPGLGLKPCIHLALLRLAAQSCPRIARLSLNGLYDSTPIFAKPLNNKRADRENKPKEPHKHEQFIHSLNSNVFSLQQVKWRMQIIIIFGSIFVYRNMYTYSTR
jgi:hypothetical protein